MNVSQSEPLIAAALKFDPITGAEIETRLLSIVKELAAQPAVGQAFPSKIMSFDEHLLAMREYIDAGECAIVYESLVAVLESFNFRISGSAAIAWLEVGLTMD